MLDIITIGSIALGFSGTALVAMRVMAYLGEKRSEGEDISGVTTPAYIFIVHSTIGGVFALLLYMMATVWDYEGSLADYAVFYMGFVALLTYTGVAMLAPRLLESIRKDKKNFQAAFIMHMIFQTSLVYQLLISVIIFTQYGVIGSSAPPITDLPPESYITTTALPISAALIGLTGLIKGFAGLRADEAFGGLSGETYSRFVVFMSMPELLAVGGLFWALSAVLPLT